MENQPRVETVEYVEAIKRMLRAGARRVARGDEHELAAFAGLEGFLEEQIKESIQGQLDRGKSWSGIAKGLGITRQGAFRRWSK